MEKYPCPFPVADSVFQWLRHWLQKNRWSLAGALAGGLLAYMFAFTNKLPNYDDVFWLFSKGATLESGRWGLLPLSVIFPDYSMPWIFGILSLLILAVGTCLIVDIFRIHTPLLQALLSAAIVCFPSQICTYTYMFTACAYAVAFTLSILAVRFLQKGTWPGVLAALGCMVYSVSIYQSYIAITATLLILLLVKALLTTGEGAAVLFRRGVGYVLFLGISMGVYWLVTKVLWMLTDSGMGSYASYAFVLSPEFLLRGLRNAYTFFFEALRYGINGLMPTFPSRLLYLLSFLAVGLEVTLWMLRDRDLGRSLLMLFLLLILPLSMNCMYLFIEDDSIHTLVLYSYAMIFVLFALVAESALEEACSLLRFVRRFAREGLVLAMLLICMTNIFIANEAYLNMHLAYENTYAITNSVFSLVQSVPGYTQEEPIAILGDYRLPEYYRENFTRLERLIAVRGIRPTDYSAPGFWENFCGFPAVFATEEECLALQQTPEYARMPAWPDAGCVQRIGSVIAVKFS